MNHKLLLLLAFLSPFTLYGWGVKGHRAVGDAAYERLTPKARLAVDQIRGQESLADLAVWPDEIKPPFGSKHNTPEGRAFNTTHKDNRAWHFVNLPLGTQAIPSDRRLAPTNSIIEMVNVSISVLRGRSSVMSKREALCWLAHLTGDIHQPLHVGCGYYVFDVEHDNRPILVRDPLAVIPGRHDSGGNAVQLPGTSSFHSFWDTEMVEFLEQPPGTKVKDLILKRLDVVRLARTRGGVESWSRVWALESVAAAGQAYADIEFETGGVTPNSGTLKIEAGWKSSEAAYKQAHASLALDQLSKGAFRLADVLNVIFR